jgi:flagellar basal body-associated protein FliL
VVGVLVVGGAVAGLYFSGMLTAKKPHEVSLVLPGEPVFHQIPKITVDISPSRGHVRPFIRLVMQAELQGESAKTAYIEREAKILDALQTHLRTLTVEDLQDTAGTERLRKDIVLVINNIIRPERAITVFFKEIMVR